MEGVDLKICADCGIAPNADCTAQARPKRAGEKGGATAGFDPELRMKVRMDTLRVSGDPAAICHGTCCGTGRRAPTLDDVLRHGTCASAQGKCKPRRERRPEAETQAGMQAETSAGSEFKVSEIMERKERLGRAERMRRGARRDAGCKPRRDSEPRRKLRRGTQAEMKREAR